jgi:hypothetical protein
LSVSGSQPPVPPWSVWVTGQADDATQLRQAGCVSGTDADIERIPPAIAAHAIAAYTHPGELVLDPDCGTGTVLVAALRAGRHALGLTTRPRSWTTARANITAARRDGAWRDGSVLDADPRLLASVRAAGLIGRVGLVITALREPVPGHPASPSDRVVDVDALAGIARCCEPLLRSGGRLAVVVRPRRLPDGALVDTTSGIVRAGWSAGLVPVERCVALTAALRGDHAVTRASLAERRAAARAGATGTPIGLVAHREVVVFQLGHDVELAAGYTAVGSARRQHTDVNSGLRASHDATFRGGRRAA